MSSWQAMTREQLERVVRELGERRGNRQAVHNDRAHGEVSERVVRDVMERIGGGKRFNVRQLRDRGRMLLDVHVAGEPAGAQERVHYNNLRAGGKSHSEAIDVMTQALGMPEDHVKPAVAAGFYTRVSIPMMPGGHIYSRRQDMGRLDNPNAAAEEEAAA